MPERTPLILVILKLPFQLIQIILFFIGFFTYLPIYLYGLIFSRFLFSSLFQTSQAFYILLCLPRAIISLGAFIVGFAELFAIYWAMTQYITFTSTNQLVASVVSAIIFTVFSFRFGYNFLVNILKLPKLKSVEEHFALVWYGVEDILSAILTVLTFCLIFRTKTLFVYNFESEERKYLPFCSRLFILSLLDIICFIFWIIIFVFHWRYPHAKRKFDSLVSEEEKYVFLISHGLNAVFDIFFILMFIVVLFNPFFKARRLLTHMNKLSVSTWRKLIFFEFLNTISDFLALIMLLLSCAMIYQIPLSLTLYIKSLKMTDPYDFQEDEESLQNPDLEPVHGAIAKKACEYADAKDTQYQTPYFILFSIAILDILLLISNTLLILSIYRYLILQRKMQALRLENQQKEHPKPDLTTTYAEYRTYICRVITMDATLGQDASTYSTYPGLVLSEIFWLLFDLPIIIMSVLLFLAPWRLVQAIRACKTEWDAIVNVNEGPRRTDLRSEIVEIIMFAVLDFFKLFSLIFTLGTVIRLPTFCSMLSLPKKARRRSDNGATTGQLEVNMLEQELVERGPPAEIMIEDENRPEEPGALATLEKEGSMKCLDAGVQCSLLVILDILSIPFLLSLYTDSWFRGKYFSKVNASNIEQEYVKKIEKYAEIERSKIFARFKYGFPVLLRYILALPVVAVFCILLWRLPTLFILIRRQDLTDALIDQEFISEEGRNSLKRNRLIRFGYLIWFCLKQLIKDLIIVPLFILLILFPWRMWPALSQIYQYNLETSLSNQISKQRYLVAKQLCQGIGDVIALIGFTIIVVTLFRTPFLFMIILKNRFPTSSLCRKIFKTRPHQENENEERPRDHYLSLKACIGITFIEFLKDLPYVVIGAIITVLAVWRVFTLYFIFKSQTDRIPSHDIQARSLRITSRRYEVGWLLVTVFTEDYLVLFKMIALMVTIYRIPIVLFILLRYLFNIKKYQTEESSLRREIEAEYNKATNTSKRIIYSLLILILVQRVPSTIKRLLTYRKNYQQQQKELRYKQAKPSSQKEGILSLNDITWDTYGRILQYLDIQDIAKMNQVNKKFHTLNQKDFYWEYQYRRDWSDYEGLHSSITYKDKCINAFKQSLFFKKKEPLSQEKLDTLYGSLYILYEEMVKSICYLPDFLLLPVKLLSLILWWTFGQCTHKQGFPLWVPLWGRSFVDVFRSELTRSSSNEFPKYEETNNYKRIHEGLVTWIAFIVTRYMCYVGFIISYIGCTFISWTNAGRTKTMIVESDNPNDVRVRFPTEEENLRIIENRLLRYFCYVAQFIFLIVNFAFFAASFGVFPWLLQNRLGWNWYEAIFGPCFILLVHYGALLNAMVTEIMYSKDATPFFSPYKAITEPFELLGYVGQAAWEHVGVPIFKVITIVMEFILTNIAKGLKVISKFLFKALESIFTLIWEALKLIFKGLKTVIVFIFQIFKYIYSGYVGILTFVTRQSLKWGTIGDLILIPIVLIWMLWPLVIPVLLKDNIYFIPTGLISVILLVVGYNAIKKVSNESQPQEQENSIPL